LRHNLPNSSGLPSLWRSKSWISVSIKLSITDFS
jgi:hypothetical protein